MRKIGILFFFLFVLFFMASCNIESFMHIHEIEHFYDDYEHWITCECGELPVDREKHYLRTIYDENFEYETIYCTICEYEVTKKHEHVIEEITVAPTCTKEGYIKNLCECGYYTISETLQTIPHHFHEVDIITLPTLTEEGLLIGKCSCDELEVALPVLSSEEYEKETISELTCVTDGKTTYSIEIYGYEVKFDIIVNAIGHSYEYTVVKPTCTEDGYTIVTCQNCNYSNKKDYVNALEHNYSSITITTVPTESSEGLVNKVCQNCSYEKEEVLPVLNDTNYLVTITSLNSCETTGLIRYTYNYDTNIYIEVEIPKADHSYDLVVTPPTCTEDGFTTYTCSACQHTYVDDYVDALGHQYTEWTTQVVPSLENKGLLQRNCSIHTDVIETIDLPILSDTDYEITVVTEATCSAEGELIYSITVDDIGFTFNIKTPIIDHTYNTTYSYDKTNHWLEASCEHDVTKNYEEHQMIDGICSICDYSVFTFELTERDTYKIIEIKDTTSETITLPPSYKGKIVDAFSRIGGTKAVNVVVPNTYKELGVISGSTIKNIYYNGTIKDFCNVTRGQNYASSSCNYYFLDELDQYYKLEDLVIPEGVTHINDFAFYFIPVTSVTLPSTIEYIGLVFVTPNMFEAAYFDGTIKDWCAIEFKQNSSNPAFSTHELYIKNASGNYDLLTDLDLTGVTSVNKFCFQQNYAIENVYISTSLESIDGYGFTQAKNIKNVYFNGTMEEWSTISIASSTASPLYFAENFYIFVNNEYVKPTTLKISGKDKIDAVYASIKSIENIYLSNDVTSISNNAFERFDSLINVYYDGTIEDWCNITFTNYKSNPMYYADNFYLLDENNSYKLITEIIIPSTISKIGKYTFSGFSNVSKITIPNSVVVIEENAFAYNTGLVELKIPSGIEVIPAQLIYNSNITNIYLPNTILSFAEKAFEGCSNLTNVYYSDSISKWMNIGINGSNSSPMNGAENFYQLVDGNYSLLTSVTIEEEEVAAYQLSGFDCLTSVIIKDTVKTIGEDAFINANNINEVLFDGTLSKWLKISFASAYANPNYIACNFKYKKTSGGYVKLDTIKFNSSDTIGQYQLAGMTDLTTINLPIYGKIGIGALANCTSLTEVTGFSFANIDNNPFAYIFGTTSYEEGNDYVPVSLKSISTYYVHPNNEIVAYGFYGLENIEEISIDFNYDIINESAFENCRSLEKVTFYSTISEVEKNAFLGCENINQFDVIDLKKYFEISFANEYSNPLYYATKITYKGVELSNLNIPHGTNTIKDYALVNTSFNNVIVPKSVTGVGSKAFHKSNIKNMYNESSLSLGGYAENYSWKFNFVFDLLEDNTYALVGISETYKKLSLPSNHNGLVISTIDSFALHYHPNLTSVEFNYNDSISRISPYAFDNCHSLTSITFYDRTISVEEYAFNNCSKLENVKFSTTATTKLGNFAFNSCSSLKEITLTNNLYPSLGTFKNCNGLTKLTAYYVGANDGENNYIGYLFGLEDELGVGSIPSSLETIDLYTTQTLKRNMFYKCNNVKKLYISTDTPKIEQGALYYFNSLVELKLPFIGETSASTTTKFLGYAFGASSYTQNSSYVPGSLTTVTDRDETSGLFAYEFYECKSLKEVNVFSDYNTIPQSCFEGCESLRDFESSDYSLGEYVNIVKGVTTIKSRAFYGCRGIVKVRVSNDLTKIENNAFYDCVSIFNLYTDTGNLWESIEFANEYSNPMAYGASFLVYNSQTLLYSKPATITIDGDVSSYAFYGCESMTAVVINKTVKKIGRYAFTNTPNLAKADIKGIFDMYYYENGVKKSFASMSYIYKSAEEKAKLLIDINKYELLFL